MLAFFYFLFFLFDASRIQISCLDALPVPRSMPSMRSQPLADNPCLSWLARPSPCGASRFFRANEGQVERSKAHAKIFQA
jgi:hypothetical protein